MAYFYRRTLDEIFTSLIKKTGSPMAPILMQQLADAIQKAKPMFSTTKDKVEAIEQRLMKDFTDEELNVISSEPEFIVSLMIMLRTSLVAFASKKL